MTQPHPERGIPEIAFPERGRLAGIDYGTVRVGVAICDPGRAISSPLTTYVRGNREADAKFFRRLVADEQLVGFVIGLPVLASGDECAKSQEVRRFADWLASITALPYCLYDERYTTVQAGEMLRMGDMRGKRRKQRLDMLAAQILLASYLESPHSDARGAMPLDESDRPQAD